jgi:PIN domain nuclease of toxin-antitoxin system
MGEDRRKLGKRAGALIADPKSEIWVSAVSVWEIANKAARGRLRLALPAAQWLPTRMAENDINPLAITHEHALAAAGLPRHHEDPFDRMLIAQVFTEDLKIVTADAQFERYNVRLIDATA